MGITSSKHDENEQNNMQKGENIADQTLVSISSGASGSSVSSFQRIKNLSLNNRYVKFPNACEKPHSLSMNNLEGELTPKKAPNSGIKQRLIKVLGGYNLLDPRSPNQLITRTPLGFEKQAQNNETKFGLRKRKLVSETSIESKDCRMKNQNDKPFSIFGENLKDQADQTIEEKKLEPHQCDQSAIEVSVDLFDGLVISKDPRSPTNGVPRTPLAFAIGILQTPSIEMQQAFKQNEQEKNSVVAKNTETKQEKSSTQTLIKSIYKDLLRRDPIRRSLIHDDENDAEVGRTTPIKKPTETKIRTPLSCVANKTHALRSIQPKKLLENVFEDNFSPKTDSLIHGNQNTPVRVQVGTNDTKLGRMATNSVSKSKSKIPVIRSRRLH